MWTTHGHQEKPYLSLTSYPLITPLLLLKRLIIWVKFTTWIPTVKYEFDEEDDSFWFHPFVGKHCFDLIFFCSHDVSSLTYTGAETI